ncbi:hypothetical protein SGPA1_10153 [Streptomyces misionensis JCM 4497]
MAAGHGGTADRVPARGLGLGVVAGEGCGVPRVRPQHPDPLHPRPDHRPAGRPHLAGRRPDGPRRRPPRPRRRGRQRPHQVIRPPMPGHPHAYGRVDLRDHAAQPARSTTGRGAAW